MEFNNALDKFFWTLAYDEELYDSVFEKVKKMTDVNIINKE
ncbi:hypothetical protein [Acinetobacter thermotolerans]